jgi:hypothetical protein
VVVVTALLFAAAANAAITPKKLYMALLTRPYPDSQLPNRFSSARVGITAAIKATQSHQVVGEVGVVVDGPDPNDSIDYGVFASARDARADIRNAAPSGSGIRLHIVPGGVPGFTHLPGHIWTGFVTGENALGHTVTYGATIVVVAKTNVLIVASTTSAHKTRTGNLRAALALLRSGLRHLSRIEATLKT